MPITYPVGPPGGPDVVKRNIQSIMKSPSGMGLLKGKESVRTWLAEPHQTFFVQLDDLAQGRMLAAAKPVAWRYLVYVADDGVAEAEVSDEESSKEPKFLAFYEGPFASASDVALRKAITLANVKKKNYELRYLKIPSVYFAAMWLHNPNDDVLIPLHNPPAKLIGNIPYSEAQIIEALRRIAVQTQEFDRKASRRKPKR